MDASEIRAARGARPSHTSDQQRSHSRLNRHPSSTRMELGEPAVGGGPEIAACAHDAAAGEALLQLSAAAAVAATVNHGQSDACVVVYYRLLLTGSSAKVAPVCCVYCCECGLLAPVGARPRVDNDGQQLCEVCLRRLSRCKGKQYKSGAGHICQSCHNKQRHPDSSDVLPPPRKRRATSDPGEFVRLTLTSMLQGTSSVSVQSRPTKQVCRSLR